MLGNLFKQTIQFTKRHQKAAQLNYAIMQILYKSPIDISISELHRRLGKRPAYRHLLNRLKELEKMNEIELTKQNNVSGKLTLVKIMPEQKQWVKLLLDSKPLISIKYAQLKEFDKTLKELKNFMNKRKEIPYNNDEIQTKFPMLYDYECLLEFLIPNKKSSLHKLSEDYELILRLKKKK